MSLACLHPQGYSSVHHLPPPLGTATYRHVLLLTELIGPEENAWTKTAQISLIPGNLELGLIKYLVILPEVGFELCELGGRWHLFCVMWVGKQKTSF